ncbi:MAG: aspartate kinase, partial [Draconibacterium sp.]|nr:aspartate kinase [Draconibacterium sp.]
MKVFKFGGASVKNADAVRNVAKIINDYNDNLVVVISAMGKITNLMESLVKAYFNNNKSAVNIFVQYKSFHTKICNELFDEGRLPKSINAIFSELENKLAQTPS